MNMIYMKLKNKFNFGYGFIKLIFLVTAVFVMISPTFVVYAQDNRQTTDINSSSFRFLICDGPPLPPTVPTPANYVPCDFKGLMLQIQHFINIAIVGGVVLAILLSTYAGYLYVKGGKGIEEAHKIFPKIFWGFILMLSAWFIVYQILSWLTGSNTFGVLLGTP